MATTGQLLRAARAAYGLTQKRLAAHLELPGGGLTVSNWECDKATPTDDELARIAHALSTTVDKLQGDGIREVPAKRRPGRPTLPPEQRKKNYRSTLSIHGAIPELIGYMDLKELIRQYRGRMYDEREFRIWVEAGHPEFGKCPSRIDGLASGTCTPGVRRRVYHWPAVKAWIISTLIDPDQPKATQ